MHEVTILGSGPAGLTAAIYTARANLCPCVIAGKEPGGQLTLTTMVENYPGFAKGIMGPQLMEEMRQQALYFGATFVDGEVTSVDLLSSPLRLTANGQTYETRSLIIATGASAQLLGLESERRLLGRGVSTCATCDGFFFRDQEIVVVGGGDSAMEEGIFLTKFASRVTIIHRRDRLRASKIMQEKAFRHPKIDFIWDTTVERIDEVEAGRVTGVQLRNLRTDVLTAKPCQGVFIAIGHTPNTQLFQGQLELDDRGYLITGDGTATSVPGVFAAGDVQDHRYRQAVTAAGSGCMAAMDAERFLENLHP